MAQTVAIRTVSYAEILREKIKRRTARVGIVGLGYVGLPLAVEFAKAGFSVTGIDVLESKIARVNAGDSYVQDVAREDVLALVDNCRLRANNRHVGCFRT